MITVSMTTENSAILHYDPADPDTFIDYTDGTLGCSSYYSDVIITNSTTSITTGKDRTLCDLFSDELPDRIIDNARVGFKFIHSEEELFVTIDGDSPDRSEMVGWRIIGWRPLDDNTYIKISFHLLPEAWVGSDSGIMLVTDEKGGVSIYSEKNCAELKESILELSDKILNSFLEDAKS